MLDKGLMVYLFSFMMFRSDLLFFYSSFLLKPTLTILQALLTSYTPLIHHLLFLIGLPVKSKQPFLHLLIKHSPIIICYYKIRYIYHNDLDLFFIQSLIHSICRRFENSKK